jgi:hypothetical protein
MLMDDFRDWKRRTKLLQYVAPNNAVGLNNGVFGIGEFPAFVYDFGRNPELPNVVHEGCELEGLKLNLPQAQQSANRSSVMRDSFLMLTRVAVLVMMSAGQHCNSGPQRL